MHQPVTRRELVGWLTNHGFRRVPRAGGHHHYRNAERRVTVTVVGHGKKDVDKKVMGHVRSALRGAGFSEDELP